jgi:hypothetical protein
MEAYLKSPEESVVGGVVSIWYGVMDVTDV